MPCRTRRAAVLAAKLAIWSVVVGLPTWFYFDRDPPVRLDTIKVEDTSVARGGLLKLRYTGFRFRNCGGDIQRIVVDAQEVVHLVQPYTFEPPAEGEAITALTRLGMFELPVSAPVPEGAAVGPARYQAVVHYRCNPLQLAGVFPAIDVITPVQDFHITDSVINRGEPARRITPNTFTPEPGASDNIIPALPMMKRRSDLGNIFDAPTYVYDAPLFPARPLVVGRN